MRSLRPSFSPLPSAAVFMCLAGLAVGEPPVSNKATYFSTISGNRFLVAEYQRIAGATISIEVSQDLVNWGVPGIGGRPPVVASISPTDSLTTVIRLNQPVTGASRYFMRALGRRARLDFDRSGTSDHVLVRNVGGGPGGAISWFINTTSGGTSTVSHGNSSDTFTPGDFDGDGFSDPAVRRSTGEFRILQSGNGGVRSVTLGSSSDAPACADYDGDGKTDPAVFRSSTTGNQFLYIGSLSNPTGAVTTVSIGTTSGFANPGDYDGDGKADFCVQITGTAGGGIFLLRRSSDGGNETIPFGLATDLVTSGDLDGDGKDDLVVVRGAGGDYNWFILERDGGGTGATPVIFGKTLTDSVAPSDYDGDGKLDLAVWTPAAGTNAGVFKIRRSSTGATATVNWGQTGDFPVARTFVR